MTELRVKTFIFDLLVKAKVDEIDAEVNEFLARKNIIVGAEYITFENLERWEVVRIIYKNKKSRKKPVVKKKRLIKKKSNVRGVRKK